MPVYDPTKEVSMLVTPITLDEAREALAQTAATWTDLARAYALALIWVESGRGKNLYRYNVGNLAAGGYRNGIDYHWDEGFYWRPPWYNPKPDDYVAIHAKMLEGLAPSAFRAYQSLGDGMRSFVSLLWTNKYAPLAAAANENDADKYVAALKSTGYSPDYGPKHAATFRQLVDSFGFPSAAQGESLVRRGNGGIITAVIIGGLTAIGIGLMLRMRGNLSRKPHRTR